MVICCGIAGYTVTQVFSDQFSNSLKLQQIEALASDETDTGKYDKETGDCSKKFAIDAEGYVTIFGKKIKVGGVSGDYTATYSNVRVDCPVGKKFYTCKECSCANFWEEKC